MHSTTRPTKRFQTMAISEEDVLKPKDPSLRNSDEWPTFNLKKISVTSSKTGEQVSLLSAHKGHPVVVSGKLDKVDRDLLPLGVTKVLLKPAGGRLTRRNSKRQEISREIY